jgi:hypothetical protein
MGKAFKICKVDGCNIGVASLGYCTKHYMRYRRHGHVNPTIQINDKCKIDGCNGVYGITQYGTPYFTKGYCMKHYTRFKKYGDATFVKSVHGFDVRKHPLYQTYHDMKGRCYNKKCRAYKDYGSRGIDVCERWMSIGGFFNFIEDMGDKPTPKHSLDRVDNNKGYSKENCRWETSYKQQSNKRNNNKVVGVYVKSDGWCGHIMVNGKRIEKSFLDYDDAVKYRKELELKYLK